MPRRIIQLLIGLLISFAAIYLAFAGVDYRSVWASLAQADLVLLGAAATSVALNNVMKALRWRLLLSERGAQVSLWNLLQLHLVGQMLNQFLPSRLGDASRIYLVGDLGVSRSFALGTVALEKIIDLFCYGLLFLLLLLLMPLPDWVAQPAYVLAIVTALASAGVGALMLYRRRFSGLPAWLTRRLPQRVREKADVVASSGLESLRVLSDRKVGLQLIGCSLIIWFTAALTNYLVLWSLQIEAPVVAGLFVLFVLLAGISITSVPGQIGIFEYLCVIALAIFGVSQPLALSFGLVLRALTYLPPLIAGAVALWGAGPAARSLRRNLGDSPQI